MVLGLFEPRKVEPRGMNSNISVTSTVRRPQAIAAILGFVGVADAMARHVDMYHDRQCSTVVSTAPVLACAFHDTGTMGAYAITTIRETARLIRMGELSEIGFGRIPVLVHVLGNGGAQILEEIERVIREVIDERDLEDMKVCDKVPFYCASNKMGGSCRSLSNTTASADSSEPEDSRFEISPTENSQRWGCHTQTVYVERTKEVFRPVNRRRKRKTLDIKRMNVERSRLTTVSTANCYNPEDRAYFRDVHLFASHLALGAIIFDSAPYFPSLRRELGAVSSLLDGPTRATTHGAILGAQGWNALCHYSMLAPYVSTSDASLRCGGRPEQFWSNMRHMRLTKRIGYVYSQADSICSRSGIKELIQFQQGQGIHVMECPLVATGHLDHLRRRPDLHAEFMDEIMKSLAGRQLGDENEEEWWDSDDEDGEHRIVQKKRE